MKMLQEVLKLQLFEQERSSEKIKYHADEKLKTSLNGKLLFTKFFFSGLSSTSSFQSAYSILETLQFLKVYTEV